MKNTKSDTLVEKKIRKGFISGTGRRKTAVASVFLYQDKGDFIVNDVPIDSYFPTEKEKVKWMRPFHLVGVSHPGSKFSASIKVFGSGKTGQLNAITHGISRALSLVSDDFSKVLRKQGLLTRDSRMVERKKYFLKKARKAPQYSKR